jgi:hypothetical protein
MFWITLWPKTVSQKIGLERNQRSDWTPSLCHFTVL